MFDLGRIHNLQLFTQCEYIFSKDDLGTACSPRRERPLSGISKNEAGGGDPVMVHRRCVLAHHRTQLVVGLKFLAEWIESSQERSTRIGS
jgi:hypothetical protein